MWNTGAAVFMASPLGLEESETKAELHVVGPVREAQLLGDALLVRLHGLGADAQLLADLGRRVAAGHENQHISFPLAQLLIPVALLGVLRLARHRAREGA